MAEKAWERRDTESAKAFEAFRLYLEDGVSRSLVNVREKLGKNLTTIEKWSARHSWVDRARAWDAEIERKMLADEQRRQVRRYAAMRQRHRRLGKLAIETAAGMLADPEFRKQLTPHQWLQLVRGGVMLEQSGMSSGDQAMKAITSGDLADPHKDGTAPSNEPAVTLLRKLEIEVIGAGGQLVSADVIAAKFGQFYDKPGG